ncbi:hypothetical protein RI129_008952 [Pyrocoelia pectoralis]|uniref:Uncharacterized protein n=1 Tax=Pyrocoelia pectoralis TaxID=417401 RepID=A0AAN7ZE70_9COLE
MTHIMISICYLIHILTEPFKEECIKETGVDITYANRVFLYSEYPEDEPLKCYIKCISMRMNILNGSSGKWEKSEVIQQVSGITSESYQNCNDETEAESNLCQNSFDMSKCFVRQVSVDDE